MMPHVAHLVTHLMTHLMTHLVTHLTLETSRRGHQTDMLQQGELEVSSVLQHVCCCPLLAPACLLLSSPCCSMSVCCPRQRDILQQGDLDNAVVMRPQSED